jgi:hypothetical protein
MLFEAGPGSTRETVGGTAKPPHRLEYRIDEPSFNYSGIPEG